MVQKDSLGQDMFLIGSHSPLRRWLAFRFCEATGRECEFVPLTSDTSEADLKARRELRRGEGGEGSASVVWFDQAVVRAATLGRVLILEGLEKAERNVLPVLNNLLENREMQLEDGRFLVAPRRYDKLLRARGQQGRGAGGLDELRLVRVSELFRVVAIGVPAPPFPGNPLDPPLRSRFQARRIDRAPAEALLLALRVRYAPSTSQAVLERLLAAHEAIWALGEGQAGAAGVEARALAFASLCYPCEQALISAARLLEEFPPLPVVEALHRILPFRPECGLLRGEALALVARVVEATARAPAAREAEPEVLSLTGAFRTEDPAHVLLEFSTASSRHAVRCAGGGAEPRLPGRRLAPFQRSLLSEMAQSASVGRDVCLIGPRGEGKTFMARQLAGCLGYDQVEVLFLFEDMTARDLLQRRSTNSYGESVWEPSPLAIAMQHGRLCVLDGLHRLPAGTITALVQLVQDREVSLYDGTRFISPERWQHLTSALGQVPADMEARGVRQMNPAFRLIGLATPPEQKGKCWLSNEVMQLFHFFALPSSPDLSAIVSGAVPSCPLGVIDQLVQARERLLQAALDPASPLWVGFGGGRSSAEGGEAAPTLALEASAELVGSRAVVLSLRQMLRAARRAATAPKGAELVSDVGTALEAALMTEFMPRAERAAVRNILRQVGFESESRASRSALVASMAIEEADFSAARPAVQVGGIVIQVAQPAEAALVPHTVFFDIPQHRLVIHDMLRNWTAGEHMLLMGNQGVGKNKLTDRVLMLLHREREYIQLHRDTTVGSLTLAPSLRDGQVVFDDSPLVKAMIHGRVLVIDEFDKAPTEVVVILKALLEDGVILLADGRRFMRPDLAMPQPGPASASSDGSRLCPIHPGFLVVALANRPGFPFLGNDFFREMGDCFACHAVQNPDQASEIVLLRSYAPEVPVPLLTMLTAAFRELREMVDAGKLSYPYSTRELVNVVRHLSQFPGDSLEAVVENVFAFDAFDPQLRAMILDIFQRHGLPLGDGDGKSQPGVREMVGLAEAAPLQPPTLIARLLRGEASIGTAAWAAQDVAALARPDVRWRGISPEDAEDLGDTAAPGDVEGQAGAEWRALELHSARSERFCEEELWWRIGCVTKEGVVIKGTNPITGSWLGEMLAMESAQGCVCILTSQMILYVHDLERSRLRELPLALGASWQERSTYAGGRPMLVVRGDQGEWLVAYDAGRGVMLTIQPRDGYVRRVCVQPPRGDGDVACAGLLADLPIAVYFRTGGRELVFACCGTESEPSPATARLSVPLPAHVAGIAEVRVLSRDKLLLGCQGSAPDSAGRNEFFEVTFDLPPEAVAWVDGPVTAAEFLRQLQHAPASFSAVHVQPSLPELPLRRARFFSPPMALPPSDFPVPPRLGGGSPGSAATSHVAATDGALALFAVDLAASPEAAVMGYRRAGGESESVAEAVGALGGDPEGPTIALSCWHAATRSLVTAIAEAAPSKINVRHGAVLVEVVDVLQAQVRRILLGKVPGLGMGALEREGAGTGGNLASQGLLVTGGPPSASQASRPAAHTLGMPACVAVCEVDDGRLALLFSDAHVRVLELRQDALAVQAALFQGMLGGAAAARSSVSATGSKQEYAVDGDVDLLDEDEDDEDDKQEDDDAGAGEDKEGRGDAASRRGSRSGRGGRGGTGRGGRGGTGRGGQGGTSLDGTGERRRVRQEASEGAARALSEARALANSVAETQRAALNLDAMGERKYEELFNTVEKEVMQLRVVLQAVEARERERTWLRGKTAGELDDSRLVDLATGERNVFKRRGQREEARLTQRLPKRLSFVVDVSGSMAYFNGDGRLDRLCATTVMLMEGLAGLDHKYKYEIVGHSGDTPWLPFVPMGKAPRNRAERLAVVQGMVEHAAGARSGDHTLAAGVRAMREITDEEADDYFVFLISDANLRGYGVSPEDLASALTGDRRVNSYVVFIAEPSVAEEIKAQMPAGHAHLVMDTAGMPLLFKDIFSRALLTGVSVSRL